MTSDASYMNYPGNEDSTNDANDLGTDAARAGSAYPAGHPFSADAGNDPGIAGPPFAGADEAAGNSTGNEGVFILQMLGMLMKLLTVQQLMMLETMLVQLI